MPLAIIAGLMESIPNIGPTVSMVPAAVVGFTISPLRRSGGLIIFLIQQFENNLIVPLVMRRAVGLNPLVTIIALMIGLALGSGRSSSVDTGGFDRRSINPLFYGQI